MAHNAALFRCQTCSWGRHCDERNPAPFAKWSVRGVIESRTCLLPMITPQSRYLLRMFRHYREGILPQAGGILAQPSFYIEAMEILSDRERQIQAEIAERNERTLH